MPVFSTNPGVTKGCMKNVIVCNVYALINDFA